MQHGRKLERLSEELKEAQRLKEKHLIKIYLENVEIMEKFRKEKVLNSKDALVATENVVRSNPEHYSCWNYRRRVMLELIKAQSEAEDKSNDLLIKDLLLTGELVKMNPKSYWLFNHRRWLLQNLPLEFTHKELYLCDKMLERDSRNFHCWDHRRWLMLRFPSSGAEADEKEFKFTYAKICDNFSNYSAWHYRQSLMMRMGKLDDETLKRELEIIKAAIFTEPNDQSVWLHFEWIVLRMLFEKLVVAKCYRLNEYQLRVVLWFPRPVIFNDAVSESVWYNDTASCNRLYSRLWSCVLDTKKLSQASNYSVPAGTFVTLDNYSVKAIEIPLNEESMPPREDLSLLSELLKDLNELLELDEDSKYCRIFMAKFETWLGHFDKSAVLYDELVKLDKFRKNGYMKQGKPYLGRFLFCSKHIETSMFFT